MCGRSIASPVLLMLALGSSPAVATTVNLTSGTTGTTFNGQSFNETRAVDITILGASAMNVTSMTIQSLNSGAGGTLGARIYTSSGTLVASADVPVSPGPGQTVTVAITASLAAGQTYRVGFFHEASNTGSCTLFDPVPSGISIDPYNDPTGRVRITAAWATPADAFPLSPNGGIPLISLQFVPPPCVSLTAGPGGTLLRGQSFNNETRGVDVQVRGTGNVDVTGMNIRGINVGAAGADVGARLYSESTLIASATSTLTLGSDQSLSLPIAATLTAGQTYRACFYVSAGSGTMFDPAPASLGGFPYTESTSTFDVLAAYSSVGDLRPTLSNIFAPLISLCLTSTVDAPVLDRNATSWSVLPVRPNPVVGSASLTFRIPERARVVIERFSLSGARVGRSDELLDAGTHSRPIGAGLRNGVYYLELRAYTPAGEPRLRRTGRFVVVGH